MQLILFSPHALALRMHAKAISQRDKLYYLLIYVVFGLIASSSTLAHLFYEPELTDMDIASDVLAIIGEVLLAITAYRINQRGDGADFIERYICICVPLSLRILLVMGIAAFVISSFVPLPPEVLAPILQLVCFVYAYRLMVTSFSVLAKS